jgi:hypothetical protein
METQTTDNNPNKQTNEYRAEGSVSRPSLVFGFMNKSSNNYHGYQFSQQ